MTGIKKISMLLVRTVAGIDDDRRVLTSLENLLASGGYGTRADESAVGLCSCGYAGRGCGCTGLEMPAVSGIQGGGWVSPVGGVGTAWFGARWGSGMGG